MQHFGKLVSALASIKSDSGADELSTSSGCLSQLFFVPHSHLPGLSLSLTCFRLQSQEPTRCVSQTLYSHSPSRQSHIMEHRVVATLQNERRGAQKLNHRLQGLTASFECMASETKCINAVLLPQIRHRACVFVVS